jgi:hypothetical protein
MDYAGRHGSTSRGRCFRYVHDGDHGRSERCSQPLVPTGWTKLDRWYLVDACAKHAVQVVTSSVVERLLGPLAVEKPYTTTAPGGPRSGDSPDGSLLTPGLDRPSTGRTEASQGRVAKSRGGTGALEQASTTCPALSPRRLLRIRVAAHETEILPAEGEAIFWGVQTVLR